MPSGDLLARIASDRRRQIAELQRAHARRTCCGGGSDRRGRRDAWSGRCDAATPRRRCVSCVRSSAPRRPRVCCGSIWIRWRWRGSTRREEPPRSRWSPSPIISGRPGVGGRGARRGEAPDPAQGFRVRLLADPRRRGARRRRRAADRGAAVRDPAPAAHRPTRCSSGSTRWSRCTTRSSSSARYAPAARCWGSTTATCARSRSTSASQSGCCRWCRRSSTVVAESGLATPEHLTRLRRTRCDAVLMGEVFMTQRGSGRHARHPDRRRARLKWIRAHGAPHRGQGVRHHAARRRARGARSGGRLAGLRDRGRVRHDASIPCARPRSSPLRAPPSRSR
mgnify:CR=1 FL=1